MAHDSVIICQYVECAKQATVRITDRLDHRPCFCDEHFRACVSNFKVAFPFELVNTQETGSPFLEAKARAEAALQKALLNLYEAKVARCQEKVESCRLQVANFFDQENLYIQLHCTDAATEIELGSLNPCSCCKGAGSVPDCSGGEPVLTALIRKWVPCPECTPVI